MAVGLLLLPPPPLVLVLVCLLPPPEEEEEDLRGRGGEVVVVGIWSHFIMASLAFPSVVLLACDDLL